MSENHAGSKSPVNSEEDDTEGHQDRGKWRRLDEWPSPQSETGAGDPTDISDDADTEGHIGRTPYDKAPPVDSTDRS